MTAFITYQDGWMSFSEDPTNPNIGNADGVGCESGPDNMMTYGDCTQITKGFIGTLILNIGNDCVTGNCPDDCSSPNCDCGVREDMIHCGNPMGWLKFKRPV